MAVPRRRARHRDRPDGVGNGDRDLDLGAVAARVLDAAEAALGARPELAAGPDPIVAGAGPDVYSFELATDDPGWAGTLVARTSAVDLVGREAGCIRALDQAGYPVPRILSDQHEPGVVVYRPPAGVNLASCMADDFLAVPRLLAAFGRLHARLHGLPLDGLDLGGRPDPLDELADRAEVDTVRNEVDSLLVWLAKNHPPGSTSVLCHGELNPIHVYVADGDPATAVPVNWTRARHADPAFDVAATVTAFWTSPLYAESTLQRTTLKMIRDSVISGYLKAYTEAATAEIDDDVLRYWQAFHLAWLATDLARRVQDEPVGAWEAAASVARPASALDDVRRRFWELAES